MKKNKHRGQLVNGNISKDDAEIHQLMCIEHADKDGCFEVIYRKPVDWNCDQMRKYFHGPICKFIQQQWANGGIDIGIDETREYMIKRYVGEEYVTMPDGEQMLRRKSLKEPLSRQVYIDLINGCDRYCMDKFGCGIPPADSVEA